MHCVVSMKKDATPPADRLAVLIDALQLPLPHPDAEEMQRCAVAVAHWSVAHFAALPERPLVRGPTRSDMEQLLREPMPREGTGFDAALTEFTDKVVPAILPVNHPRFVAFIPSAPSLYSVLGEWLCASLNCFAGVWMEAAGAAQIELLVLDWFKELLGYPAQAEGLLTSGGSEANLIALAVARDRLPVHERARAVLYQSEQRHHSIDRAARILGLLPEQVRVLPTTDDFRFDLARVEQAIVEDQRAGQLPWVLVANGGATNTGLVDPIDQLADCCARHGLWLHVDAAYGWAAALAPSGKTLLAGIDRADSITLDPHKWFAQTFDAGCVLVRTPGLLARSFSSQPEYLQDVVASGAEVNFSDLGPALTRRFRALKIWLSVKALGMNWFRELIERGLRLAELTELVLMQHGSFELLSPRGLSVVCFRYRPPHWSGENPATGEELNALNLALIEEVRKTQRFFMTSTLLRGRVALRCCYVNWRTTSADVLELIDLIAKIGKRLALASGACERPGNHGV